MLPSFIYPTISSTKLTMFPVRHTARQKTVKSESRKNRTNGSIIELHVKTAGDLARQLRKCAGYMLPSFIYPAISSTKLTMFPVRHTARQKRAGQAINDRTCVHDFCLVEHGCSVSDIFYRLQHFWYNVVIACLPDSLGFYFNINKI